MEDQIREFPCPRQRSSWRRKALRTEAGRIAKDPVLSGGWGSGADRVCGRRRIDNAKYKAFFRAKAKMLAPDEVEERIGHAIGGVCPFGIREGVRVYLDETLEKI